MGRHHRKRILAAFLVVSLVMELGGNCLASGNTRSSDVLDIFLFPVAVMTNFVPAIILGKCAPLAGPKLAARMSSYVRPERAVEIAIYTDPRFMAETVHYLAPSEVGSLIEATPDELLIAVANYISMDGNYALMAKFADHLSVEKAKSLFFSFGEVDVMLNVAYYMKNTGLLADTIAALPREDVTGLINEVIKMGAFEMSAKLSQRLPPKQIVALMDKVRPSDVANIVIHYPPEVVLSLLDKLDEDQLGMVMEKVNNQMTPDEVGALLRLSKPEYMARIVENYPPELVLQIFEKLDDDNVQEIAGRLSHEMSADQIVQLMDAVGPVYLGTIAIHFPPELAARVMAKLDDDQAEAFAARIGERMTADQMVTLMERAEPEYVATIVPLCPPEVFDAVLGKLDPEYVGKLAIHFPPDLAVKTLTKLDEAQARTLAAHIGESWTAEQIAGMMEEADPAYIATIVLNSPPEVVNAVLGKLDDAQLREVITIVVSRKGEDARAARIFSRTGQTVE